MRRREWTFALVVICLFCLPVLRTQAQVVSPITGQDAPATVCFAEGTDPEYVERMTTLVTLQNQVFFETDYFISSRWSGAQGTPRNLTWSFVPDGLSISSGVGEGTAPSNLFATMDANFAAQGGRAVWISRFQQVFDRWAALTGVTYTRITVGGNDWDDGASWGSAGAAGRGDIRISMKPIDGANNVLAYNFFPSSGDMVLDSGDIVSFRSTGSQNLFLRNTIAHEHGHGLGIQHVCSVNSNQLMEPFLSTSFDGPRQDDIRAGQRHYGDPFELNDSVGAAQPIGSLGPTGTITWGTIPNPMAGANDANAALCSIDGAGKVDWYSFQVTSSLSANVTVTPVGSTYDSTAQAGNGSCPSGATVNALTIADLAVEVYGSDGETLIDSAFAGGAGVAETISGVALPTGTYYLRVYATSSFTQSQLYRLTVAATCATANVVQQPSDESVEVRSPVLLSASATGATSVRWRRNGVDLFDDGRITGAATGTLQISSTVMADGGMYDFTATNACGTVASNPVQVTITCYPNCDESTNEPLLTVFEFSCFLFRFANGEPYGNCDGSVGHPALNVADFTCFLQRFSEGCP